MLALILCFAYANSLLLVSLCGCRSSASLSCSSLLFAHTGCSFSMVCFPFNAKPSFWIFSHCTLGILLKVTYIHRSSCIIILTDSNALAATFIYLMVFGFTALSLTAWKLYFGSGLQSHLHILIFQDSLIYFAVAYVVHPISFQVLTK